MWWRTAGWVRDRVGSRRRRRSRAPLQALIEQALPNDVAWRGDPHWARTAAAPTDDNRVTPLVDGRDAMLAIYRAIATAERSVYVADWFMSADIELVRGEDQDSLRELATRTGGSFILKDVLAAVSQRVDVRVLVWGGSHFFHPTERQVRQTRMEVLRTGSKVQLRVDPTGRFTHCHHQKVVIVDERIAFVGGIDLTDLGADRWDHQSHPIRDGMNWHDVHVGLEGPAVADLTRGYKQRWPGDWPAPAPDAAPPASSDPDGEVVQVLRTIPAGFYSAVPTGEYSNFEACVRVVRHAERFLYVENQYLWSPDVTQVLVEAIRRERPHPFRVVLLLPSHPNVGKLDSDYHVGQLLRADGGRGVVQVYSLYTSCETASVSGPRYHPVYIHAKVLIADDSWTIIASANLNGRSMAGDTEIGALIQGQRTARDVRLRLWSEHLGVPREELADRDPVQVIDELWPSRARQADARLQGRTKLLPAHVVPYHFGRDVGDLERGIAEAMVLDR